METQSSKRTLNLGSLHILADDLLLLILSKLSLKELVDVSVLSPVLYLLSNEDELWKKHCLKLYPTSSFEFKGTWKATVIDYFKRKNGTTQTEEAVAPGSNIKVPVTGFASDILFAKWWRSNVDLRTFSFDSGDVDRVHISSLTKEDFIHKYDQPSKALIIKGVVENWPAMKNWTAENLLKKYGDIEWKISHKEKGRPRMKLKDYITYCKRQRDENPLYVFDNVFGEKASSMLSDYQISSFFTEDFLELLGDVRPDYRWFVMGPMRSGTPWHVDPHGTSAWNALISGRKRWALYPPDCIPPGIKFVTKPDGGTTFNSPFPVEWFFDIYPHLEKEDKPIEFTQEPGELIYVPRGWWHCVLNIDDTVAVTQNFINRQNLHYACEDLLGDFRVDDFQLLKRKIQAKYPEFESLFVGIEEGMKEAIEKAQQKHKDFDYFGAVNQVCEKNGIPIPASKDLVRPADSSTNLVYFYHNLVFKFYRDPKEGEDSYFKESEIYGILKATQIEQIAPKLIAKGRLNEGGDSDKWKWPYVVTTMLKGDCLGEVFREISPENLISVAKQLGLIVRNLHEISLEGTKSFPRDFLSFLKSRRNRVVAIHKKWGSISFDLIDQIESYLPKEHELDKLITREVLIHADLTDDNILGHFEDDEDLQPKKKQKTLEPSHVNHRSTKWVASGLIDFGDSRLGDMMYELIALYVAVFKCDKKLLRAFLEEYGIEKWPREDFAKIAMSFTLLHACDAMRSVYSNKPSLYAVRDWKAMENELWNLSLP